MSQDSKIANDASKKHRVFSAAMQNGFDSLRLEGIPVSEDILDDLYEYDQGRITKQELIARGLTHDKSRE